MYALRPATLVRLSSTVLLMLLFFGILTLWISQRWAWSLFQTGTFALGIAWAMCLTVRTFSVKLDLNLFALAAVVVWGLAQLASYRTVYRWETWNSVWNWTVNLVLCFIALQVSVEPKNRRRLLLGILYFGFGLSVISMLQMFSSGGKIFWAFPSGYDSLVFGPFVYQNQYAAFIELIVPLALYEAMVVRRSPLPFLTMAAIMVASVIATQSRAGTAFVLFEVISVLVLALRRSSQPQVLRRNIACVAVLLVIFTAAVGVSGVWRRFQLSDPYGIRREILISSLEMVRERPWAGFGLGTWATAYPRYALFDDGSIVNQAHNDWVQWTAEGGLPLLILMLAFVVRLIRPAVRSVWGIGLLVVFLHCLIDYPMQQRPALAAFIFAFSGAVASVRRTRAASDYPTALASHPGADRVRCNTGVTVSEFTS